MTNDAPAQASVEARTYDANGIDMTAVDTALAAAKRAGITVSFNDVWAIVKLYREALSPPPTVGAEDEAVGGFGIPYEWFGADIPKQERDRIRLTELYKRGDTVAVWVNEGDLYTAQRACRPAPAADGQRVKALEWSEPAPPDGVDSFYDHIKANTPFGQFSIEWKGWKDSDPPAVFYRGDYVGVGWNLDEAKKIASDWYDSRIRACLATDKEGA